MPRTPIHPGEIPADELQELGLSAAALARELHVPANRISKFISGKRFISADTALRTGKWFGDSPEFRLNLQKTCDPDLERVRENRERKMITPEGAITFQGSPA